MRASPEPLLGQLRFAILPFGFWLLRVFQVAIETGRPVGHHRMLLHPGLTGLGFLARVDHPSTSPRMPSVGFSEDSLLISYIAERP